jgi:hypothetical protein
MDGQTIELADWLPVKLADILVLKLTVFDCQAGCLSTIIYTGLWTGKQDKK